MHKLKDDDGEDDNQIDAPKQLRSSHIRLWIDFHKHQMNDTMQFRI